MEKVKFVLKATVCCIIGMLLMAFGKTMLMESGKQFFGAYSSMGASIQILGFVLWFLGCYFITKGKGQSTWYTLLGFIPILGIIFLILLPNKNKELFKKQ
jgi:hypothetical protein